MAVKITCPACAHEMNLKSVKAGRFKPNCTHCKEPFLLVVSDTEPAQLKVTRIASTATVQASTQAEGASASQRLLGPSLGVPALGFGQGAAWLSCALATLVLCMPILVKPLR